MYSMMEKKIFCVSIFKYVDIENSDIDILLNLEFFLYMECFYMAKKKFKYIGTNFITIAHSEEKLLTIQERYFLESKRCHFSNGNSRKLSLRHLFS